MNNKLIISTLFLALTAACSTPTTMLKNNKTGEIVTCGGGSGGSWAGGAIGYNIQKSSDKDCVIAYQKKGFKIIENTPAKSESKAK